MKYLEIKQRLGEPIPHDLISHREQGGANIAYINITDCKQLLDERAGVWASQVISQTVAGNQLVTVVRLAILAEDMTISHDGVGFEKLDYETYGDTASNSYSMALKRAAESHGLGRELYQKDHHAPQQGQRQQSQSQTHRPAPPPSEIRDPLAKSLADQVTPKQLGMIRALAREAGIDPDEECKRVMKCDADELSKRAASSFIDHLKQVEPAAF